MFLAGSTNLTEAGQKILKGLIPIIRKLPNHLSINGHTDALPSSGKNPKYSNWELSADRALATRRYLENNAVTKQRVKKIVGHAAEELVLPDDPTSAINRRIEIILLRGSHVSLLPQAKSAPRSLLTTPNSADTLKLRQKTINDTPIEKKLENESIEPTDLNTELNDPATKYTNPFATDLP